MANTKSAIKRVRRISRQTAVNRSRKSKFRSAVKKMNVLIEKKDKKEALSFLPKLNSELMKISKTGVIKKQNASRNISRITKKIIGEVAGFNRVLNSEACEFVSNITGDNSREVVSFGTEAGLFQELGISTVVCGPGSIEQAHKIDEFIELHEMKKCLKFLEGIKDKSVN